MNNLTDVYKQLDKLTNKGISVGSRTYEKSFGLFKNPVFLITFFTIVIGTAAYYLYHYFKKQSESECYNYSNDKDCPDNCLWDPDQKVCQSVDRTGNVCPDYFSVGIDASGNTTCTDDKEVLSKGLSKGQTVNTKCYSGKKSFTLIKGEPDTADYKSKCQWIKNCGSWEGQSLGRSDCNPPNKGMAKYF